MIIRRPTIIALRARRKAFEIATKVAHPELTQPLPVLAVDAPPDEPPPPDPDGVRALRTFFTACGLIALSVGGFVLVWYVYYFGRR